MRHQHENPPCGCESKPAQTVGLKVFTCETENKHPELKSPLSQFLLSEELRSADLRFFTVDKRKYVKAQKVRCRQFEGAGWDNAADRTTLILLAAWWMISVV